MVVKKDVEDACEACAVTHFGKEKENTSRQCHVRIILVCLTGKFLALVEKKGKSQKRDYTS
jgi:glucose dehydrogenase